MHFAFYTHIATRFVFRLCAVHFLRGVNSLVSFTNKMVEQLLQVTSEYKEQLRRCEYVPRFSFGRRMLRDDGDPNRLFLMYLFCEQSHAIQFLKDIGLLRSKMQCNTSGRDMTWSADSTHSEGFRWWCQRRVAWVRCNQSAPIKVGSWFQQSKLTLQEILLITYDTVRREQASWIQSEDCLSAHTVTDWGMFCRETMLVFLEGSSVNIGGPNKTVEIDDRKFGRRKYHRGHPGKGQWVFGGVEWETGETFLVPVPDRTADTLMTIIRDCIESGTTVVSDSWTAYRDLGTQGYTHRTVNHSIQFVDPHTGAHTNTIQGTWRSLKAFLGPYNRREDYEFHLAHYMFVARCKAKPVPPYLQFLRLVANTNWSQCCVPRTDRAT